VKLISKLSCICFVSLFFLSGNACTGQESTSLSLGKWFTASADLDGGYRETQFFTRHYNTGVFQWDSRVELWLPPFRSKRRWGPYLPEWPVQQAAIDLQQFVADGRGRCFSKQHVRFAWTAQMGDICTAVCLPPKEFFQS